MFFNTYDVRETDNNIELALDMPGYAPNTIQVQADKNRLTISAKRTSWRGQRSYERAFTLPDAVDAGAIEAQYDLGQLTVRLPKRQEALRRTIPVTIRDDPT